MVASSEHMSAQATPKKKSGMVVLIGRSNAGKSTLLNALVGTKVAITSPKPQTTRHTIQGVVNAPEGQIVFVDTPGVFTRVPDQLTQKLNEAVEESLHGIDAVVYVADATRHIGEEEQKIHRMVSALTQPKILVLNKMDVKRDYIDEYLAWRDEFAAVIEISALQNKNVGAIAKALFEVLPEGEPLYPEGTFTDRDAKFRLEELIREKVFLALHQEVPYTTAVDVEEHEVRPNGVLYIRATILTHSPRYRKMIIGAGAKKIKHIGMQVRKELELVTNGKVFVDLDVKVDEKWQERFQ